MGKSAKKTKVIDKRSSAQGDGPPLRVVGMTVGEINRWSAEPTARQVINFDDDGSGKKTIQHGRMFLDLPTIGALVYMRLDRQPTAAPAYGSMETNVEIQNDLLVYRVENVVMRLRTFLQTDGQQCTIQENIVSLARQDPTKL